VAIHFRFVFIGAMKLVEVFVDLIIDDNQGTLKAAEENDERQYET